MCVVSMRDGEQIETSLPNIIDLQMLQVAEEDDIQTQLPAQYLKPISAICVFTLLLAVILFM